MAGQRQVVGAFLVKDQRVLLGLRAPHRRYWPDVWDCVGGHLEGRETHEAALARELLEEIGITPTRFTFLAEAAVDEAVLCRFYRVDAWDGGEPRLANDEHVDLRWFGADDACALTNLALDSYRPLIRRIAAP